MKPRQIETPLDKSLVEELHAGDRVLLSGTVYTARDAAHERMVEGLAQGNPLPFDPRGAVIYYCGPTRPRPGRVIGSAGPTTSSRMDGYVEPLLQKGVKGFIGKGDRSPQVAEHLAEYKAIYFAAVGGLGALLSLRVTSSEVIAYPELGPEAIYRLEIRDFPAVVALDTYRGELYRQAVDRYRKSLGPET